MTDKFTKEIADFVKKMQQEHLEQEHFIKSKAFREILVAFSKFDIVLRKKDFLNKSLIAKLCAALNCKEDELKNFIDCINNDMLLKPKDLEFKYNTSKGTQTHFTKLSLRAVALPDEQDFQICNLKSPKSKLLPL